MELSYAIIICGKIGTGKTTLSKKICLLLNADYISFGDYIRFIADSRNTIQNRTNLQNIGLELIRQHGYSEFVKMVINHFTVRLNGIFLIDGVRDFEVFNVIKGLFDETFLIFIDLSKDQILRNIENRDNIDINTINIALNHTIENKIDNLKEYADMVIYQMPNEQAIEDIASQVLLKFRL